MNRFSYGLIAIIALLMCSCKKDGMNIPSGIRPYKMDIVGAKAIGCNNGSTTKASDGEMQLYDRGLFKIDEQGNISTVATYFTEDKKGNKDFKDYKITVTPGVFDYGPYGRPAVQKISSDFLLFIGCGYYFENGEMPTELNNEYRYLLVRISDGLIFHIPNEFFLSYMDYASFAEDKYGTLYVNNGNVVGKITVADGTATFQQINTTGSGTTQGDIVVLENGVVCSMGIDISRDVTFLWPNGGFCSTAEKIEGSNHYFSVEDGLLCVSESYDSDSDKTICSLRYVNVGNIPGDISLTDSFATFTVKPGLWIYKEYFLETETHYMFYSDDDGLIAVNKRNGEHKIIPVENIPPFPSFSPQCKFDGKYWSITDFDDENGPGFYWFDPNTFQYGFVKVDNLPSYAESEFYNYYPSAEDNYTDGYVNFEVVRPSDGYNITIKINITTGRTEVLESAPERIFTTFIRLS